MIEERHGSAGALRTLGGLGGPCGAPLLRIARLHARGKLGGLGPKVRHEGRVRAAPHDTVELRAVIADDADSVQHDVPDEPALVAADQAALDGDVDVAPGEDQQADARAVAVDRLVEIAQAQGAETGPNVTTMSAPLNSSVAGTALRKRLVVP